MISRRFRKRVEAGGTQLPILSFRLEELSEYAGNARYDEPLPLDEPTRELLRNEIATLREFVLQLVGASAVP